MAATAHIDTGAFPNTTTLYGWLLNGGSDTATITNAFGGKDLTRTGALTSGTNHLGESVFCTFDGTNDWLSSTDAVFNFTGTFSIGGWFMATDWTPGASVEFISRLSGASGWDLFLTAGTGVITFRRGTGSSQLDVTPSPALTDGTWHHIVIVSVNATSQTLYIDGSSAGTASDTTDAIVAAGNLEVGSAAGGLLKWNGGIQDFFVHNGTALTASDVARIYNYGQRTFIHLIT